MASADLREELLCSICLYSFKDPVMLKCGHNYCRVCIDRLLDIQNRSGGYSCPECRQTFEKRPVLMRNINLNNIAERLRLIPPNREGFTGICCTYCVDSPVPAVKSCLMCEASLCDKHLKVHSKSPEHVLSDPRTSLENQKCSAQKRIVDYCCTDDSDCICVSCNLIREYQVEVLDEASEKNQQRLRNVLQNLTTKKKETEERVQSLEERRRKAQEKASGEAERVTALFVDTRRRLDNLEKRILSEISRQEKNESLFLTALIHQLEMTKDELSKKMRHIEELCNMTDKMTVLQEPDTGHLCDPKEEEDDEDMMGYDVDNLDMTVVSETLHALCDVISGVRSGIYVEDPADILLDVDTAANNLHISDDLKTATCTQIKQNRPQIEERFQYNQVISSRSFTSGRHYWDVEISRSGGWMVGMCYPSIDRRGRQSYIGDNEKSWGLGRRRYFNVYFVMHERREIRLPDDVCSNKFRICLDYEAGELSFYELCGPVRHLHTFTTTFTEPLHAVVCVFRSNIEGSYEDNWLKILS